MLSYLSLAISCLLVSNIVLTQFLGICPFLGISTNRKSALGMGIAVMIVTLLSSMVTYGLYKLVLLPLDIVYMQTVVNILVIACLVQLLEMVIKKYIPSLYESFGVYLPLITTNCIVLGVCLNVINYECETNFNDSCIACCNDNDERVVSEVRRLFLERRDTRS